MASAKDFPDLIREGDLLLGHSYRHPYGGAYYLLLFPDWPEGYRRDVQAAVYLEDKERGEHRRVVSETLSEAIRRDYWREIDWENAHPMTVGPGPGFRPEFTLPPLIPNSLAGMAQQQRNTFGMADGSYMTPQPPKAAPAPDPWTCPKCGAAGNTGRFCPECGSPRPQKEGEWTCPNCGQTGNGGNFCAGCGAKKPD